MSNNLTPPPAVQRYHHADGFHVVVGQAVPRAKLTREIRHELIARHHVDDSTVDVVRVTTDALKRDGYLSMWIRERHIDTLPVRAGDDAREAVIAGGYTPTTTWTEGAVRVAGVAFAA